MFFIYFLLLNEINFFLRLFLYNKTYHLNDIFIILEIKMFANDDEDDEYDNEDVDDNQMQGYQALLDPNDQG